MRTEIVYNTNRQQKIRITPFITHLSIPITIKLLLNHKYQEMALLLVQYGMVKDAKAANPLKPTKIRYKPLPFIAFMAYTPTKPINEAAILPESEP